MSYFKSATPLVIGKKTHLEGAEAWHILKSRRVHIGEKINLQDPTGERFLVEVVIVGKADLVVLPLQKITPPPESPLAITLFQAAVKEKSLDTILQKTTELGVAQIAIWNSKHSPEKINAKFKQKIIRWQKIVDEACKQSNRQATPSIALFDSIDDAVATANRYDAIVVFDLSGTETMEKIKKCARMGVVIGPEGGLDSAELAALKNLPQVKVIKIGPRILRADTAAIAAITILSHRFGDLN